MNHESIVKKLPLMTVLLGAVAMVLRICLYTFCLGKGGLLAAGHPLETALWVLTALTLGIAAAAAWKLDGSNKYKDNFSASRTAAAGHVLFGLGVFLTALLNAPLLEGNVGLLWKATGLIAGPCLLAAGLDRAKGKRPHFLLHLAPCMFLVLHIVSNYRRWSGDPQLQDYVFTLFGTMALMFFCFYTAAFEVGSGRRRMHLFMGLAAVYLCMLSIPGTEYLYLYVGGILWVLSDLCTLTPKPKPEKKPQAEDPHETA